MKIQSIKNLPSLVRKLCLVHDAWIIGGACVDSKPKDFDVCISFANWQQAASLIPDNAEVNTFGGWKIYDDNGNVIDVWPGDFMWLMTNKAFRFAWHPRSGVKYEKVEEFSQ